MTIENNTQVRFLSLLDVDQVPQTDIARTVEPLLSTEGLTFSIRAQLEVVDNRTVLERLELLFEQQPQRSGLQVDGRILYAGVVEKVGEKIRLNVTSRPGDFQQCWCLEKTVRARLGETINFGGHALIRQEQPRL